MGWRDEGGPPQAGDNSRHGWPIQFEVRPAQIGKYLALVTTIAVGVTVITGMGFKWYDEWGLRRILDKIPSIPKP